MMISCSQDKERVGVIIIGGQKENKVGRMIAGAYEEQEEGEVMITGLRRRGEE